MSQKKILVFRGIKSGNIFNEFRHLKKQSISAGCYDPQLSFGSSCICHMTECDVYTLKKCLGRFLKRKPNMSHLALKLVSS